MAKPGKYTVPIIGVFALIVLALMATYLSKPPEPPKVFVAGETVDSYENALFRYEISRYPSQANVSNISGGNLSVGVNTEPKNINFGIVPTAGSFGTRFLTFKNTKDKPVLLQLRAYGDIAPFVEFSMNDFTLNKGESVRINAIFRTKNNTVVGNYRGEIDIIVRQSKYW